MSYDFDDISPRRRAADRMIVRSIERFLEVFASHWLFIFNFVNLSIVGIAILVPVLMHAGLNGFASTVFSGYHAVCHQLPYRSDFVLGYQVAICQRDVAIYGSMGLAGVGFSLVRAHLRPLSWQIYLLLLVPMALDGFTQLFGWRESNWILRTVTGALFGFSTVWLAYPHLQFGMRELRESLVGRGTGE